MPDLSTLKTKLIDGGYSKEKVNKAIAYLSDESQAGDKSQTNRHSVTELYSLVV